MTKTKSTIQEVMSAVAARMGNELIDWSQLEVRKHCGQGGMYVNAVIETDLRSMESRVVITMHVLEMKIANAESAVFFAADVTTFAALVLELEGIVRDHRWGYDELESLVDSIHDKKAREKCESCGGTGFDGDTCCRKCEGSMSIEKGN